MQHHQLFSPQYQYTRRIIFIDAISITRAKQLLEIQEPNEQFTCINTTSDFNQNKWLGQELDNTLIFFDDKTRLNSLLAVFGCIKALSLLVLACDVAHIRSYFKRHHLLPALRHISCNLATKVTIASTQTSLNTKPHQTSASHSLQHQELKLANKALHKNKGIIHLIGKRGSGKSTLLGTFIVESLNCNHAPILLCSPNPAASRNTLNAIRQNELNVSNVSRETFEYCTADKVEARLATAQLIVIDEAATLPKATIQAIIKHTQQHNKKLILSTTIEGYEGTGQSYRLRYLNHAGSTIIKLSYPKRYSINDKLYQLCQQFCQPNPVLPISDSFSIDGFYLLSTEQLRHHGWTMACFALLQDAHYKTTPNDLARFYDEPALFALQINNNRLIAAAYAVEEKLPLHDIAITDIIQGTRRAKNAMTQQALIQAYQGLTIIDTISDTGFHVKPFAESRILRISRIATSTQYRRQGIASQLLNNIKEQVSGYGFDFLSTSFSGSKSNISFWTNQDFAPARIGLYPNKANHEYAIMMLYSLSAELKALQSVFSAACQQHFRYFHKSYTTPAFTQLFSNTILANPTPSKAQIISAIHNVIDYHRDINWILPALFDFINNQPQSDQNEALRELFNHRIRQRSQHRADKQQLQALLTTVAKSVD